VEGTEEKPVVRLVSGRSTREPDIVSVEAALSMVVSFPGIDEQSLGLTMRTPGQDEQLIVGYLHSEGIIDSIDHVMEVNATEDTITAHLTKDANFEPNEHVRRSTITSSCGICGKDSISNLLHVHGPPLSDSFKVNQQDVSNAVTNLSTHQNAFKLTGGTHACARVLRGGVVIDAQEDIGRHNAMDKLIGNAVKLRQIPIKEEMVVVSGRASFELVQKALRAGFPVFISVGAPSSLAVDLANEHGMTLISFAAETRMTVFSGSGRVEMP
jgi:FdhD protein